MTLLQISKKYANFVRVGSDGNVGMFDTSGSELLSVVNKGVGATQMNLLNPNGRILTLAQPNNNLISDSQSNKSLYMAANNGNFGMDEVIYYLKGYSLTMNGVQGIIGTPDLRTGVTAADASPITIFSGTAAGTRYKVEARILATAGTSATYKITWTEGGVAQTVPLTVSAVDTEVHDNFVIAPDSGTNITAQITSLTTSTVNVDAIVSVLG